MGRRAACSASWKPHLSGRRPLPQSGAATAVEGPETRPAPARRPPYGGSCLIEAKFDAELTQPQMGGGCLNWLPQGQHGALIYLVPQTRMPAVRPALLPGPCQVTEVQPPDLAHADAPWLSHARATAGRLPRCRGRGSSPDCIQPWTAPHAYCPMSGTFTGSPTGTGLPPGPAPLP